MRSSSISKTKARDRGYARQHNLTGAKGQPLTASPAQVVIYIPDNGRDPEITGLEYQGKTNGAGSG